MNILVTGASGFVGRHLVRRLAGAGGRSSAEVFGTCFPERPEHCADLCRASPSARLVHVDLRSADAVSELVRSVRPDRIYHLAAISHVRTSWEKRLATIETNLMGTFHLYEAVRAFAPKARILFVSSSDVYGDPRPGGRLRRFREDERDGIVSPYAFTKAGGELLSDFYFRREGLDIVVARPFPHAGPGQTADFVCSDWARQIALIEKGKAAPEVGVGNIEPRRDYTDVRDVVRAYDLLMKKGEAGEVYNVASGRAVPLKTLLRILLSLSTRKIEVRIDPEKLARPDVRNLVGSTRKIRLRTGWEPRIPLRKTLSDLLESWRAAV